LKFLLSFYSFGFSQIKLLSWNIENLGQSNQEIILIANIVRDYDIIVIQEVVADMVAQAVARLADELNKGSKWNYTVSDPTSSSAYKTERYAYIWKTSKVNRLGKHGWKIPSQK
jgi:endonuclease/exonuclease/phosphatase family metal-dependent hydrolase